MKRKQGTVMALACALALSLLLGGCGPAPAGDDTPEQPQAAPAETDVEAAIFLPDENAEGLVREAITIPAADEEELIGKLVLALVDCDALPAGTAVQELHLEDGVLTLDLNSAFGEGVSATGTTGETMILGALVNSLWETLTPESLTLTVDGEPLETGHDIYDEPFTAPLDV